MQTKKTWLWAIGIIIILLILVAVPVDYYNSFVSKSQAVDSQWSQVETQYQRRVDLIPNLVNTAKGFMAHEEKVFEDIANSRAAYMGAKTTEEKVQAANELEGSLARLLAIFENYPTLKSDATMLSLMSELAGTENRISVERKRFNEKVETYNISVKRIPGKLFASLFGFKEKAYFEAQPGAEFAPKVEF